MKQSSRVAARALIRHCRACPRPRDSCRRATSFAPPHSTPPAMSGVIGVPPRRNNSGSPASPENLFIPNQEPCGRGFRRLRHVLLSSSARMASQRMSKPALRRKHARFCESPASPAQGRGSPCPEAPRSWPQADAAPAFRRTQVVFVLEALIGGHQHIKLFFNERKQNMVLHPVPSQIESTPAKALTARGSTQASRKIRMGSVR